MDSIQSEPTFHLFEVTDPAQVEASRKSLPPYSQLVLRKSPLRVVTVVITAVTNGRPVLISAGGFATWVNSQEGFEELFQGIKLPCSLPWGRTPGFIRDEFDDILAEEGGLSEEKNHWVEIVHGDGAAVIPW